MRRAYLSLLRIVAFVARGIRLSEERREWSPVGHGKHALHLGLFLAGRPCIPLGGHFLDSYVPIVSRPTKDESVKLHPR